MHSIHWYYTSEVNHKDKPTATAIKSAFRCDGDLKKKNVWMCFVIIILKFQPIRRSYVIFCKSFNIRSWSCQDILHFICRIQVRLHNIKKHSCSPSQYWKILLDNINILHQKNNKEKLKILKALYIKIEQLSRKFITSVAALYWSAYKKHLMPFSITTNFPYLKRFFWKNVHNSNGQIKILK